MSTEPRVIYVQKDEYSKPVAVKVNPANYANVKQLCQDLQIKLGAGWRTRRGEQRLLYAAKNGTQVRSVYALRHEKTYLFTEVPPFDDGDGFDAAEPDDRDRFNYSSKARRSRSKSNSRRSPGTGYPTADRNSSRRRSTHNNTMGRRRSSDSPPMGGRGGGYGGGGYGGYDDDDPMDSRGGGRRARSVDSEDTRYQTSYRTTRRGKSRVQSRKASPDLSDYGYGGGGAGGRKSRKGDRPSTGKYSRPKSASRTTYNRDAWRPSGSAASSRRSASTASLSTAASFGRSTTPGSARRNLRSRSDSPKNNREKEIMRWGYPTTDNIRVFRNFVLAYDNRNKTALWVCEHLNEQTLAGRSSRAEISAADYAKDTGVHKYWQADKKDYSRSGYDRGHMAAAENHNGSRSAKRDTFTMSNIAPQVGEDFQRYGRGKGGRGSAVWRDLERHINKQARRTLNTWVLTGPLYVPYTAEGGKRYVSYEVIGKHKVAVPNFFYKAALFETDERRGERFALEAYMMPNTAIEDRSFKEYRVELEEIERVAGYFIFPKFTKKQ